MNTKHTLNIHRILYFLSETMAFLSLEPQCPISLTSMINENNTEVPLVLDSDPTTCLALNPGQWMRVSLPYIRVKGQFDVSLMGNLKCTPMFGLSVSVVNDCESGTCSYSQCIASDLASSDGMGGCKYRCLSTSVCNHIVVDIAGLSATAPTGALCEIVS